MRFAEARRNVEAELSSLVGFTMILGESAKVDYCNDILGYKIGAYSAADAAKLINGKMTKSH